MSSWCVPAIEKAILDKTPVKIVGVETRFQKIEYLEGGAFCTFNVTFEDGRYYPNMFMSHPETASIDFCASIFLGAPSERP